MNTPMLVGVARASTETAFAQEVTGDQAISLRPARPRDGGRPNSSQPCRSRADTRAEDGPCAGVASQRDFSKNEVERC